MYNNAKISTVFSVIIVLIVLFAAGTLISKTSPQSISAYPAPNQPLQLNSDPYPGPSSNQQPQPPAQIYSTTNSQSPQVRIPSAEIVQPMSLGFTPSFPQGASPSSPSIPQGWSQLFFDDSPLKNMAWPCDTSFDYSDDGFERYWASAYNYDVSSDAAWPASGGANAVNPQFNDYPSNMYTWFFCGRHDLTNADAIKISFDAFIDIPDYDDYLQIAVGVGGSILWTSVPLSVDFSDDSWRAFETVPIYDGAGQQQVWIGFQFISDNDSITGEGVWLDNIELSAYRTPSVCGNLDPGDKGLNIDSRDPRNDIVPIIRPGDISVLDDLDSSTTDWVRFVFKPMNGETLIDLEDYDFMVDSLCDRGISVIAVVNEETISHVAYAPSASAYRQAYFDEVAILAEHFENRITYWEVWNEPDNFIGGTSVPPYMSPFVYAPLLAGAYDRIKVANPDAEIVYGGLASAWDASRNYFDDTFTVFQLSGMYPFDYFAIHPYTDGRHIDGNDVYHGIDPDAYMQNIDPPYDTILDPFLETMNNSGLVNTTIWVTELGWNSSRDAGNDAPCISHVLVYETEQEDFLTKGFDFLFNNVHPWGLNNGQAVEKVVWYQFMDVGIKAKDVCPDEPPDDEYAWSHGIYNGILNPKPSWWAFWAYPLDADDISRIYLPVIEKDGSSSSNYTTVLNTPLLSSPETTGDVQITYAHYAGNDPNEPNEFIEIKNNDTHSIQLHNWTLTNAGNETFSFPYLVLQPGQVCRIYTNEYHTQWCGFTFEQGNEVWNNGGDTITLNNEAGQATDTCSYQYQTGVDGVSCPNFITQPPDLGDCGCPIGKICPQASICSVDD